MDMQTEKKHRKRHRNRRTIFIIVTAVTVLLIAVFLIGTFYGTKYNRYDVFAFFPTEGDDLPPVSIYRIGNEIYVPVSIDESSKQVVDNIPYYYGKLSDNAYAVVFDGEIRRGRETGVTDAGFLKELDDDPTKIAVYTVHVGNTELEEDFRILAKNKGDLLVARINQYYSREIREDWYAFAAELDIIFDVQLWKSDPEKYYAYYTNLKKSPYYMPSDDGTEGQFWHQFRKHLAFFASDVKELLT